jgi:hypothetical protein
MADEDNVAALLQSMKQQLEPLGYTVMKLEDNNRLFDGNDEMFKRHVADIKIYGEYGIGLSTKWILRETHAFAHSVDTDQRWVTSVKLESGKTKRLNARYCNVGNVQDWGWPTDYTKRDNFQTYTRAWWVDGVRPDLVLVDGRFRVCCFLTSLKYAEPGTKIIFDDYFNRPQYHLVEEYLKPVEKCNRQALFVKPSDADWDVAALNRAIDQFQFVRE